MARKKTTPRATVRVYRHGLGDCHLITLHGAGRSTYRILIDCGVILGTEDAGQKMTDVMDDIVQQSGGKIDLLVATHEHWDHLSGFVQAQASFDKLSIGAVWLGWTEDPDDAQAIELKKSHDRALALLQSVAVRLQVDDPGNRHPVNDLLGFFGAVSRVTTRTALEAVRAKASPPRYCDPKDPPMRLEDFGASLYVLGPPRDPAMLKKILPSSAASDDTTYHLALQACDQHLASALAGDDAQLPFASPYNIPIRVARSVDFFQTRYWGQQDWRRIDADWLDDATELALALDSMTNNTSLVLAIALDDIGVLLFAADAQVGNWLSWDTCEWPTTTGKITGPELLGETVFYKVGHHGSRNATRRVGGLELMKKLRVAIVPVDHEVALKRRWGDLPLKSLMDALALATGQTGLSLRTDTNPDPGAVKLGLRSTPLYFEVDF